MSLTKKQKELIETLYRDQGVSMKNIANYFMQIGQPMHESRVSKHLIKAGISRAKGGRANVAVIPNVETIYTKALRLMAESRF